MAKSKKESSKKSKESKSSKKKSVPEFAIKATDPNAERVLAQHISTLEDAGQDKRAKEARKAHGKFREFATE